MLWLVPGRQKEKKQTKTKQTLLLSWKKRTVGYIVEKVMTNAVNSDGVIPMNHWEINHRLNFNSLSFKPSPAVSLEVMWSGKAGERFRGKTRKLRWDHLQLYTSGDTLYLCRGTHSSFTNHLDWTDLLQSFQLFLSSEHSNAFHLSTSIPTGVNLTLFSGLTLNIGPFISWTCLVLGNWSLLFSLQFSIHLQLTFSLHSQTGWALRFWYRVPLSAMNP